MTDDASDEEVATDVAGDTDAASDGNTADDAEGASAEVLDELFATIEQRKRELPEDSYTASLFTHESGENEVLEKLGEEATEVLLAARDDDREALAHESADLVYHLLVLLAMKDMDLQDLRAELESRF